MTKEQPERGQVLKRVSPAEIIKVVERIRGEPWAEFADRYGDSGRDLTLYLARRRSGLTLGALGRECGITEYKYKTVATAITRFEVSLTKDSAKRKMVERCICEMQKVET